MSDIKTWHVLVVEDEPDGQEVVHDILHYFNIRTDIAANAEDALRHLQQTTYTAVIIDLALPGMDGVALMEHIRNEARWQELPCIAITAYHTSVVKQKALAAGFSAYLAKPLDDTALVRTLDRIIDG